MHTTVGIIGGGPAGLLLSRLLHRAGVDCVVLESRDRAYVEQRQRAGILEQSTVDALREADAAERLDAEGLVHDGVELRWEGRAHRIDFPSLTGGRRVWVYAQTEVVKDLIALQTAAGAALHFGAQVRLVEGADTDRPTIRYTHEGQEKTLTCDYVVGCDGFHGVTRTAVPEGVRRTYERVYPYSWFGILADVAPSCDELIYAHSPRGFALHSMRSPEVSRLYLQVPNGTDPADWSDERIWDELDARFALDGWKLERGPITSKSVLPMRSSVTEPMRYGRVFLAGDAAHIVPPTGAKGLNLAAADVIVLARALIRRHTTGSTDLLDAYSDTCLRRVWRAEHFSYFMTTTLHTDPDQSAFDTRLQISQLDRISASPHAAAELAMNYAGLPLP
ncbi:MULTISPECIES: 4-hydroxybenzoate 3-monooxygenase [unclassified Streptomyces]|uniref:4-hydroxybenzoate 3-monooxygenase n=1 Tax=unclassified Streptomyces TaxID=2593676 RepID=UPI002258A199|nr:MULTISPECIES: 4-hydroxybenzoate 3-monooxygenase [unclassified Streptomyces]MCX4793086.1 4-hydroxybenzoate 3-monooxygenase [Streptomyces sp. NBC_01242]WSP59432.1 4-hydroxybenzoate 3-monooxygenase [Streptomyces sp. NBC_01241]WSP60977.1 4-hydroxybenzoate 3-monooxygenase [Streptomyces sp. NBC_01240]WSU20048.1 4-hydroxybenzoate 3-monooxygenase [Streptomyces sp. NBC_01108]